MIPTPTWLASLIAEAQHSVATGGTNIILSCRHAYRDACYEDADGRLVCPECAAERGLDMSNPVAITEGANDANQD